MKGRIQQRRAFALVTCVLWLLGVEVLPNLHLAFHDRDHTHGTGGTIVASFDHDHDHDHDHGHDHALGADDDHRDRGEAGSGELAIDHPERGHHLAGGISHHAVALHRPPPPLLAPVEVARTVWRLETLPDAAPRSAGVARPTSRGPPAV